MKFFKDRKKNNNSTDINESRVEEVYFCRNLDGTYSESKENPENKRLIFFNSQDNTIFCPYHLKWEHSFTKDNQRFFGCGKKTDGFLFNFEPIDFLINPKTREKEIEAVYGFYWSWIDPKDKESLEYYNFYWPVVFKQTLDSNGISKDLIYIRLYQDKGRGIFVVQLSILDRPTIQTGDSKLALSYPTFRIYYSYDIKTGKFITGRALNNKFTNKMFNDLSKIIPSDIYDLICNKLKNELRDEYGKKLEFNFAGKKDYLQALVAYPYEPNIYEIAEEAGVKIDRNNSDIYNQFCNEYGIKSYRSLRKAYNKNPIVLLVYKNAVYYGFSDVNILNRIFNSDLLISFFLYIHKESIRGRERYNIKIKFCIEKMIEKRGQLPTVNLLEKNIKKDDFGIYYFDTVSMFSEYFNDFSEEVKNAFYKEGFCKNIHDIFSECVYKITNKNVVFEYSKSDYELEDEINGYEFKLPVDSYTLTDIGIKLKNCVGSYSKKIINKDCLVVYATKDGEYRLCIEVRVKHVWQRRIINNQAPQGEDLEAVELWQKKHQLTFTGNSY